MTAKQGRPLTEEEVRRALEAQGISGRLIPSIPTHAISPDWYVENSKFVDNPLGFLEPGGALVTDGTFCGYMEGPDEVGATGQIKNLKGDRVLGTYQIVSRWRHPKSRSGQFQYAVRLTFLSARRGGNLVGFSRADSAVVGVGGDSQQLEDLTLARRELGT
jgi:hypothetical protein